jgi:hypothetical protein
VAVPSITPPAYTATVKCTGKYTCAIRWYIKLFKIGNLPIAHDSLWVLFIENKFEFEEVLHCTYGV